MSVYLIVGLSKSSWKPCVFLVGLSVHVIWLGISLSGPSCLVFTIFHRDEFSTVPVWGSIGLFQH